MRDMRGDLQDCANLVAAQIKSVQRQFDDTLISSRWSTKLKLKI